MLFYGKIVLIIFLIKGQKAVVLSHVTASWEKAVCGPGFIISRMLFTTSGSCWPLSLCLSLTVSRHFFQGSCYA